jgi:hypothetical protein
VSLGIRCVALVLVASGIAVPQNADPQRHTGTTHGTAVFVTSKANKYLREAGGVTLVFMHSRGKETRVQTNEIGDYISELQAGQYCVSAFTKNGQSLALSPQQLKCFHVATNKDTRLDVMLEGSE